MSPEWRKWGALEGENDKSRFPVKQGLCVLWGKESAPDSIVTKGEMSMGKVTLVIRTSEIT